MDKVNIFIIVSAVVIILLLWVIVGVRHLKHLKQSIADEWENLDERLRKRHNLLPNLIETVRKFVNDKAPLLERMITERLKAANEYSPGAKKIEFEHDLSKTIDEVIGLRRESADLAIDTNFLELRKEIDDLEKNISEKEKKYNEMVRSYNKHRKTISLRPLAGIFGFGVENIFEVEI
jgi:LemA protein